MIGWTRFLFALSINALLIGVAGICVVSMARAQL